ncbi:unnamed protein product, partial [Staurois parvus]
MTAGTGSSGIGSSGSTAGIGSPGMTADTGSSGIGSSGSTAGIGGHRVTRRDRIIRLDQFIRLGTDIRLNHGRQVLRRQAHRFGYWQDGIGWKEFRFFLVLTTGALQVNAGLQTNGAA